MTGPYWDQVKLTELRGVITLLQGKTVNVLFTSVGRRVELLRAFRQAYDSLKLVGRVIALDVDPLAPALQVADRSYIVPRLNEVHYIPELTAICVREHVDLVFPLIDPDILILAQNRDVIEATGARLAVVPLDAARVAADKWATHQFFRSFDLATPRSWLPNYVHPEHIEYPLFIKPRHGSGAKHAFKVHNARELKFFMEYVREPIIQEFLAGPEITNDVICDTQGNLLAVVSRQRIEVRWGEVAKGITVHDQTIIEACAKTARALPAIGPITVQCILKDNVPHFTEINTRFAGGIPLGIAAGVDAPRWLLARAADIPIEIPALGSYQTGLYMTRFDESYFLTKSQHAKIACHHL